MEFGLVTQPTAPTRGTSAVLSKASTPRSGPKAEVELGSPRHAARAAANQILAAGRNPSARADARALLALWVASLGALIAAAGGLGSTPVPDRPPRVSALVYRDFPLPGGGLYQ